MGADVRRRSSSSPATQFRHDTLRHSRHDGERTRAPGGKRAGSGTKIKSADIRHAETHAEIHPYVFLSLFCCFAIIMAAFFILFRGRPDAIFMIVASTGYLLIYTALPLLMLRFETRVKWSFATFLQARIAIFGGTLSGRDAWLQICLIPFMLMLATLGICLVVAAIRP